MTRAERQLKTNNKKIMKDYETPKILMGRENPNGWKLEHLLMKLVEEVSGKSSLIKDSYHPMKDYIVDQNRRVSVLLEEAAFIQAATMKKLDSFEPNRGPLNPRL